MKKKREMNTYIVEIRPIGKNQILSKQGISLASVK